VTTRLVFSCALLGAISLFAASANACSCTDANLEEQLGHASQVFVARVTSVRDLMDERTRERMRAGEEIDGDSEYGLRATYSVLRTIKGDATAVHELSTGYNSAECGIHLYPGNTYLVLTDESGHVGLCGGTREVEAEECWAAQVFDVIEAHVRSGTALQQNGLFDRQHDGFVGDESACEELDADDEDS
jgi:hypothetical protein